MFQAANRVINLVNIIDSCHLQLDEKSTEYFKRFCEVKEDLNKEVQDISAISKIVLDILVSENIKVIKVEFSFIHNEFLFLMYIENNFKFIRYLNNFIFEECYKNKLSEQLNSFTFSFVPYEER